jgi:hypothetical protein
VVFTDILSLTGQALLRRAFKNLKNNMEVEQKNKHVIASEAKQTRKNCPNFDLYD